MRRRLAFGLLLTLWSTAVAAEWPPPGADLERPRILLRRAEVPVVQERLGREPYRTVLRAMSARTRLADGVALDDHSIAAERFKARAAKNLAFLFAIDRTLQDGVPVAFATAAERQTVGARVHDLLRNMYTRSRLAVEAPLGGWDRDISTSEELLQYATAYDTLVGAGYDLGTDDAVIVANIAALAGELYDNYVHPETVGFWPDVHQNNHRSKSGAALVVAAIALTEQPAGGGTDPDGAQLQAWLEYGLDQADLIMRYALVTGDGAYGEGPFYLRYASQNLLPFARAWDRFVGGATWTARGVDIPSLWRHPLWARSARWMLDMTLPDGSLAPVDDGNPGRAHYFGALPTQPEYAWRWANAPVRYETDGNVDLGADAIVTYDDTVAAAPPDGPTTAFYFEGGNAIFRSGWSPDAVVAIVQAEHDTASEFGRDRNGRSVAPQSHEHAEPGAFLLHAYGERLALDPGYLDFGNRTLVNQPEDHNIILVDGKGPLDYLTASARWKNRTTRPPVDGHASLSATLDSEVVDVATVTTRYGQPATRSALITRRVLFVDDHYLVFADTVHGPPLPAQTYTWLLHGNGGVSSGGTFDALPFGGRWTRPQARLDVAWAFEGLTPRFDTATAVHEAPGGQQQMHTVLHTSVTANNIRALQLAYPTRVGEAPAETVAVDVPGTAALLTIDGARNRRILAFHRRPSGQAQVFPGDATSLRDAVTDGVDGIFDAQADGVLRLAWVDDATSLTYGGVTYLRGTTPGALGIRLGVDIVQVIAANDDPVVSIAGLTFVPQVADGACHLDTSAGHVAVTLGRERRVTLRLASGNSRPAADPGPDQRVDVGAEVQLDGSRSCDADREALTFRWQLTSAPAGSAWSVSGTDTATPTLLADRVGPYRLRLIVTDARRFASRPGELLVIAGAACADGIDNDLDGWFDSDDAACRRATWTDESTPPSQCTGDCDADGAVTIDDLVTAVAIAVNGSANSTCVAADADNDGSVTIDELIAAVGRALAGCD